MRHLTSLISSALSTSPKFFLSKGNSSNSPLSMNDLTFALISGRSPSSPTGPSIVSIGIPWTPNFLLSAALASRCSWGRAQNDMVLKYSLKSSSVLSELTNTSSKSLRMALSLVYASDSLGVKARHGGHQCALKYSMRYLSLISDDARKVSVSPLETRICSGQTSLNDLYFQGKFVPSLSSITSVYPCSVITFPSPSAMTRWGIPSALYFPARTLVSLALKGMQSQGISAVYSLYSFSSLSNEQKMISKFFSWFSFL
mmetsp:Transcript_22289/g.32572  ORF Transcript_22289/g.32572 Transcript_22289/m.32572 type:complete len:257 (-) Transcript_22289:202-972(-)